VIQGIGTTHSTVPYFIEGDPVLLRYDCIRDVWYNNIGINKACQTYNITRSHYYELEDAFISSGILGLFPTFNKVKQYPDLETLVLMVKRARPSISQTGILRIAEALPSTKLDVTLNLISEVLNSHGLGINNLKSDPEYYSRLQRKISALFYIKRQELKVRRDKLNRKQTFYMDDDIYHKRLELLRELYFSDTAANLKKTCLQFGVSLSHFYNLDKDYRVYGPWAILPSLSIGSSKTLSATTQLEIILSKLRYPGWSGQEIVDLLHLKCSRYVVNRVIKDWRVVSSDNQKYPPSDIEFFEAFHTW